MREAVELAELENLFRVQRTDALVTCQVFREVYPHTKLLGQGGDGLGLALFDGFLESESVEDVTEDPNSFCRKRTQICLSIPAQTVCRAHSYCSFSEDTVKLLFAS